MFTIIANFALTLVHQWRIGHHVSPDWDAAGVLACDQWSRLEIMPQIYWSRPRPLFLTVLSPGPRSHFLLPQKNITIEFRKISIYQVNWVKVLLATLTTNFLSPGNQGWCWSDWAMKNVSKVFFLFNEGSSLRFANVSLDWLNLLIKSKH